MSIFVWTSSYEKFSTPLSDVNVLRNSLGSIDNLLITVSLVIFAVRSLILVMRTSPVFLSTRVFSPTLLFLEMIESPSQCPTVFLVSTSFGLSSIGGPFGLNTLCTERIPRWPRLLCLRLRYLGQKVLQLTTDQKKWRQG